ncbi:MAG: PQQ-dependent sugar dehydrogenase, partial [Acidobacteriota bacterium]
GTPYLDIRDRVLYSAEDSAEIGLLGLAFHPNYADNGYFFVAYTRQGDAAGVVSRFSVSGPNPDESAAGSERVLLVVPQPGANHNLNHVTFGPDGHLYISAGDGGYQPEPRCTPQEGDNLLGKILRLDVDTGADAAPFHSIPADNPFVDDPTIRDEIWALGLRNPWRFDFDDLTGDLWLTDVGQRLREEIDFLPAGSPGGQNWGFKMMEGFACRGSDANCSMPIPPCNDPAYSPPVIDYGRDATHCAIIGGHVYRGAAIPEMQGAFLTGDYCGATHLAHRRGDGRFELETLGNLLPEIVSFGEDSTGESYYIQGDGLYRITDLIEEITVAFTEVQTAVGEGDGTVTLSVRRSGDAIGAVSVDASTVPFSADGTDFTTTSTTLTWADGDTADKSFTVPIVDDAELEGEESFLARLDNPIGAELGEPSTNQVVIVDNEAVGGTCVPTQTVLCLGDGRFRVSATWRDFEGVQGAATATSLASILPDESSGLMWFFDPGNIELLVKVLDACGVNDRHWVFFSAATSVEYEVRILDNETGLLRTYTNPLGAASPATTDTDAFPCL